MKISLVSFTKKGAMICSALMEGLGESGHQATGFSKYEGKGLLQLEEKLSDFTRKAFADKSAIVFIGAAGIAVRAIAPFIAAKDKDPAVIVVDEKGEYVIPILSGHLGGANELARQMAEMIKGKAVITTATDLNEAFAVDVWASRNNLHIENVENIKYISAAVLNGEQIGLCCDYPLDGELPGMMTRAKSAVGIHVLNRDEIWADKSGKPFPKTLLLRPKVYFVGIGCKKGVEDSALEAFFLEMLEKLEIPTCLVSQIATIDIKKEEAAIVHLCEKYGYPLKTYSSEQLRGAKGEFTASEFVKRNVGVDNVCERSASLASQAGRLILKKTAKNKCTIAIAIGEWRCSL